MDWEPQTDGESSDEVQSLILTRKFAEIIDGIDLAGKRVGDLLRLHPREAGMLIAEGWARPTSPDERRGGCPPASLDSTQAGDRIA